MSERIDVNVVCRLDIIRSLWHATQGDDGGCEVGFGAFIVPGSVDYARMRLADAAEEVDTLEATLGVTYSELGEAWQRLADAMTALRAARKAASVSGGSNNG